MRTDYITVRELEEKLKLFPDECRVILLLEFLDPEDDVTPIESSITCLSYKIIRGKKYLILETD